MLVRKSLGYTVASVCVTMVLLATGCATLDRHQTRAEVVPQYDAKTFYETVSIRGASFSNDESKLLISTDQTGVYNAYAQPVGPGPSRRLTDSKEHSIFGVSWFPQDDRFLYTADQNGNELNHVFVMETNGTSRDLTPGDNVKAMFVDWSGDKNHFWIMTNERDPQHFDLYRYYTNGYERERVFTNDEGWMVADVSKDGRWVALNKVRNNADSDIFIWDAANPADPARHITPHEGNVQHDVKSFTPDSRSLYYVTDGRGEFMEAWSYDLSTGQHRPVIKSNWDVQYVYFSENGRYRVTGENVDARTHVTVLDTQTGRKVSLPQIPDGDVGGVSISRSEKLMAFYVNGDRSPSNLHLFNLESGDHRQLTETLNPSVNADHLVDGQIVRYKSFDGLKIPAILYRPHGSSPRNKVPAMLWVHGGPGGQSRLGYNPMIQHLVNHGYAVLAVNNRGSSGYGKTFFHLDDKKHGDVDLKDCVWARTYLESLDWVDGSRIGILGGSYGGFMVVAALAFEPDAFDVGVDIFGVTNWLRTLKSIPPWWAAFRESLYAEMGDPATDEERLRRISPLFHASNIRKPLLVVQGANDPRVLQAESDEIVEAVRKNGVPVEYVIFPDEGHGFLKKDNRITASDAIVDFLNQYLKGNRS